MKLALTLVAAATLLDAGARAAEPSSNGLAGGTAGWARFDTNQVHYLTLGKGMNVVVFVHGWSGEIDFWRFQVPALAEKARLILIDLPGHGQSDKPEVAYTMDFFSRAIDAVMRDAKVEKATLVGHSMGTPVICRFYRNHPEQVAALVAVDGALRRFDVKPEQIEEFIGPFRKPEYREHASKFIGSMFPNAGTEALRDRVVAEVLKTPQRVMVSAMEGMWRDQSAWAPEKIDVPLLVVNAKSPFSTPEYEAHVRKIAAKVDYRTMDGVGHFLMLEKPAEFNAILVEFLKKNTLIAK